MIVFIGKFPWTSGTFFYSCLLLFFVFFLTSCTTAEYGEFSSFRNSLSYNIIFFALLAFVIIGRSVRVDSRRRFDDFWQNDRTRWKRRVLEARRYRAIGFFSSSEYYVRKRPVLFLSFLFIDSRDAASTSNDRTQDNDFRSCTEGKCMKRTTQEMSSGMWFGPRLGKRRKFEGRTDKDAELEALANAFDGSGWAVVALPGKRTNSIEENSWSEADYRIHWC